MVKIFCSFLCIYLCLTEISAASFSILHHITVYDSIKLTAKLDAEKGFFVCVDEFCYCCHWQCGQCLKPDLFVC